MPHLKELYEKYRNDGLVLIGVHTTNAGDQMATFVREQKIGYPVALDIEKKTVASFAVDSFPDYYVIDRSGKLRVADLANVELDRVIPLLLKEKPEDKGAEAAAPAKLDAEVVLAEGLARAKAAQRRLLVHLGAPW